eukprot:PhM_4_TR11296/c4_g2_i1/m.93330
MGDRHAFRALGSTAAERTHFHWSSIPRTDVDVLLTHNPPFGILDVNNNDTSAEHWGCEGLLETVKSHETIVVHMFGHVHNSAGLVLVDGDGQGKKKIAFSNGAMAESEGVNVIDVLRGD